MVTKQNELNIHMIQKILAFDKDISFNNNCNYNKFDTINEIYYNEYSSLFTKNNETNKYDNLNLTSDIKSLGNILTKKKQYKRHSAQQYCI